MEDRRSVTRQCDWADGMETIIRASRESGGAALAGTGSYGVVYRHIYEQDRPERAGFRAGAVRAALAAPPAAGAFNGVVVAPNGGLGAIDACDRQRIEDTIDRLDPATV